MTRRDLIQGDTATRTLHGAGEHLAAFLDAVYCESPVGGLTHSFYRYPGTGPPIKAKEYNQAVKLAEGVVRWAEKQLQLKTKKR